MPTPFEHLVYADLVLNHPGLPAQLREFLHREIGSFLLGTTAADVQSITGQGRVETHFYRLSEGRDGSPAGKMLRLHEELAHPAELPPARAAFITGYLVHLAWDEIWAWDIFVPFYRDGEQWLDRANSRTREFFVHHNALRVWLDRKAYAGLQDNAEIPGLLRETVSDHWLPFAPDWALAQWRDWLVEQLEDPSLIRTAEVFAERLHIPVPRLEAIVAEMTAGDYAIVPGIEAALASYEAAALIESLQTVLRYWGIERRIDRMSETEVAEPAT
ncbi:MAG: hypothetical protein MUQ30_19250 [Anaerolineae bacterium]|nr:hypothetical protein [Anaerolineae bacterium]